MKHIKKTTSSSLAIILIASFAYLILEPAIIKAAADTAVVTATVSEEVTISSPANANFSGSIPGVSGNPGAPVTASLTWTVKTNNNTGFNLKIHASQTNALFKDATYFFSDHTATPSFGWTAPGAGVASFGFTIAAATAADTATAFLDTGAACGSGANTGGCWSGFVTSTDIDIINRTTETTAAGEAEVVNFKAESNAKLLEDGSYTAIITATASLNP